MDVALLNTKITVQKNTVTVDKIGNRKNTWSDWYSCFATISGESPSESSEAGTIVDGSKISFTVRWCKNVSVINSTNYRVLYNGEIYNILGLDHMSNKRSSVKLKCQRVSR